MPHLAGVDAHCSESASWFDLESQGCWFELSRGSGPIISGLMLRTCSCATHPTSCSSDVANGACPRRARLTSARGTLQVGAPRHTGHRVRPGRTTRGRTSLIDGHSRETCLQQPPPRPLSVPGCTSRSVAATASARGNGDQKRLSHRRCPRLPVTWRAWRHMMVTWRCCRIWLYGFKAPATPALGWSSRIVSSPARPVRLRLLRAA